MPGDEKQYIDVFEARAARYESGTTPTHGLYTENFTSCIVIVIRSQTLPLKRASLIHASRFSKNVDKLIQEERDWVGENCVVDVFLRPGAYAFHPSAKQWVPSRDIIFPNGIDYPVTEVDGGAICVDGDEGVLQLNENLPLAQKVFHPDQCRFVNIYKVWEFFGGNEREAFEVMPLIYDGKRWVDIPPDNLTLPRATKKWVNDFKSFLFERSNVSIGARISPKTVSVSDCMQYLNPYCSQNQERFLHLEKMFSFGRPHCVSDANLVLYFSQHIHQFLHKGDLDEIFITNFKSAVTERMAMYHPDRSVGSEEYNAICNYTAGTHSLRDYKSVKDFYERYKDQYTADTTGKQFRDLPNCIQAEIRDLIRHYETAQYKMTTSLSNAEKLKETGNQHARAKRYQQAIECYDQAVKINPAYAVAWLNKGLMHKQLADTVATTACLERCLEINEGYSKARFHLGRLLFDQENYQEACRHFEYLEQSPGTLDNNAKTAVHDYLTQCQEHLAQEEATSGMSQLCDK